MAAASTENAESKELRGTVLAVFAELLKGGRGDEMIALVTKLVSRNHELELLLAKLRDSKNRGERVSEAQLALALDALHKSSDAALADANSALEKTAEENSGRPEPTKPPKQPAVRRKPSSKLRRVENLIPVPDGERACPVCGAMRRCIAHEITEVIDLIPAEVIVRLDTQEILACDPCDAEVVRAPMGDKVIVGGAYGSQLVADLVVGKYRDALPLHRQGEILKRLGLEMPSSSMSDQITWATDLLRPIWRVLVERVLAAKVMHLDGTGLPVRDRDAPTGIVTGSLWGYVGDKDCAVYLYTSTGKRIGQREGEIGPLEFLEMRKGPVVADAAGLFDPTFHDGTRTEIGCNMHARRYFVKALDAGDVRAAVPLLAFKTLYDVEAAAKDLDDAGRLAERQRRSKSVYDQLVIWCQTYRPGEPPASLLGKALQYTLNHRVALTRFLDDGGLPIDNGIVERLHRRPAVGRRNYLFAGSHAAAERAAIAYSVLGTCLLLDVNPVAYLADILPRLARGVFIARDLPAMMPAAWKDAHPVVASPAS